MQLMNKEIYDAFRSAGVEDEQAAAAAKATTSEVDSIKSNIVDIKLDIVAIKSDVKLLRWMLGLVIVVEVLPYLKSFIQ